MTRVLIIGSAPLPPEESHLHGGPGIRTWQLLKPLLEEGQELCLVAAGPVEAPEDASGAGAANEAALGFPYYRLTQSQFDDGETVKEIASRFKPSVVIGATAYPSYIAAGLGLEVPVWADLFGDVRAEGQARAAASGTDEALLHYWWMLLRCWKGPMRSRWSLRLSDTLSSVSSVFVAV